MNSFDRNSFRQRAPQLAPMKRPYQGLQISEEISRELARHR
jgi:hypothetical protein